MRGARRGFRAGLLAAVLLGAGAATVEAAPPAPPSPWAALAEADLRAIHETLLAHHPGPLDESNPGFNAWLEQGYARALERARRATSFEGWQHALMLYTNGFHDGHLRVSFTVAPTTARWPGWTVALQGGRYVVTAAGAAQAPELPAPGGELLSCDGRAPEAMLREDVLPYEGKPALEASRTAVAPLLFVDWGNPWRKLPQRCRVRQGGQEREVTLAWTSLDAAEARTRAQAAAFGPPPPFAIRDFGQGGLWVSLPVFYAVSPEAKEALTAAVRQASSWRERPVIVLDVRGNTGGSSQWGKDLLRGLYGADLEASLKDPEGGAKSYVEWRVSPENQRYLVSVEEPLTQQFGKDAPIVGRVRAISQGLARAHERGEKLWREPERSEEAEAGPSPRGAAPASPVKGRVFVLTDGKCASACLDFVQGALRFPGVTHVGLPTSADTPYMELRSERLPSGLARLHFALKVYRNWPRAYRPFLPAHRYGGDISDTAGVERWVLGLVGPQALEASSRP